MKSFKKILLRNLLSFFLFIPTVVFAATTHSEIDEITKRLQAVEVIRGQFTQQKKLHDIAHPLKAEGNFIFWKTRGLYLATQKPFFNAMTLTGSDIINWDADGNNTISKEQNTVIQREINKTLLAFFGADLALIQQRFDMDWTLNKNTWQINLRPKSEIVKKNMQFVTIRGEQYLESLTVASANGDETTIEFTGQVESQLPSATECKWFFTQSESHCGTFN